MTSSDWQTVFIAATAVFTLGGVAAWRVSRRESKEASAERKLAAASRETLEQVRLTPRLSVELKLTDTSVGSARLIVRHLGDSPVRVVDELRIRMRNDTEFRMAGSVWGPWKLQHGADGADAHGWSANPRTRLLRGDSTLWAMESTTDPNMLDFPGWRTGQSGKPARLYLIAIVGERVWEYPIEIHDEETISPVLGGPVDLADTLTPELPDLGSLALPSTP